MCGIAGIFNPQLGEPVQQELLEKMSGIIKHRGPDDQGVFLDTHIGLAHRRLSIIDLAGGHQPLSNEDGTVWVCYNGEIYNFLEIKADLEGLGHQFKTHCDTEVLVHLFEEEGLDGFLRLNGMFAFALWDRVAKRVILVRDRFGIKPLYYTVLADGRLLFASEIKSLLSTSLISAEVDLEALSEQFTFQNYFGDKTLFKNIKLLPQGQYLIYDTRRRLVRRQYWDIVYREGGGYSEKYYTDHLLSLFTSAVKRQLMSEVPIGSYLSSGMDSGAITAVAAREKRPFHTFTCGFDTLSVSESEKSFDERVEAQKLACFLHTQHFEKFLRPIDMPQILPHIVWHLEDFRVGISYQIYRISEMISNQITVVLSGVGGDELFAGYPWRHQAILGCPANKFEETYYKLWIRFFNDVEKRKLFANSVNKNLRGFSTFDSFKEITSHDRSQAPLNRALYFDAKTFLNGLFIVEDKLSMAHSIETRVPFMDNNLVDFILGIPWNLKLRDNNTKYILKKAMLQLLPEEIISRKKVGFTPPDKSWYQTNNLKYIEKLLFSQKTLSRGYFNPKTLRKIWDDHINNRRDNRLLLWSLMCFEWWNRIFIDGGYQVPSLFQHS